MKKNKLTHANRMSCYMHASMYEIMGLLGWNRLKYTTVQYEAGVAYLWATIGSSSIQDAHRQMRLIEASPLFWGWWKLHWYLREKEYLNAYNNRWMKGYKNATVHTLRANYHILHNPYDLANAITHKGKALDESYCRDLVPKLNVNPHR